jgi:hypothetical protein
MFFGVAAGVVVVRLASIAAVPRTLLSPAAQSASVAGRPCDLRGLSRLARRA